MVSIILVLAGVAAFALSGVPAAAAGKRPGAGRAAQAVVMALGSAAGIAGVVLALVDGGGSLDLVWALPWGSFSVGIDPLSAFFLLPAFVVPTLGAVYGVGYGKAGHGAGRVRLALSYGILAAGMALVLVARDGVLFLMAWEAMALAAFFALTADDGDAEARKAGWVYLIATHVGTLCLLAMFALWAGGTGSFALDPAKVLPLGSAAAFFVLALVGFGLKAGIAPLHFWLPGAHANAPSHVSAVMSGVMLKMGVYGILRAAALLPAVEEWQGAVLLGAGALTALGGIAFALGQRDLKRALAYSSAENVGIIAMGIGLALLGRFHGRADWVLLGSAGALLHTWNHALFKPLLFMGAGAAINATGTRDLDLMGGLGRRAPALGALFALGSVAICALPPLNGFAGEWLLYLGFFGAALPGAVPPGTALSAVPLSAVPLGAVALAMVGALALACFVKLYGAAFLGEPRASLPTDARGPSASMVAPMALLAALCLALGLCPQAAFPLLERATAAWTRLPSGAPALGALAPAEWLGWLGAALAAVAALVFVAARFGKRARAARRGPTWDCGYAAPAARMQYTGTSSSQPLAGLLGFALRQRGRKPAVAGAFPAPAAFSAETPDPVLDKLARPLFSRLARAIPRIHALQGGRTHVYVLYVAIAAIVLLLAGGLGVAR